jgi:hypothetical protein
MGNSGRARESLGPLKSGDGSDIGRIGLMEGGGSFQPVAPAGKWGGKVSGLGSQSSSQVRFLVRKIELVKNGR